MKNIKKISTLFLERKKNRSYWFSFIFHKENHVNKKRIICLNPIYTTTIYIITIIIKYCYSVIECLREFSFFFFSYLELDLFQTILIEKREREREKKNKPKQSILNLLRNYYILFIYG